MSSWMIALFLAIGVTAWSYNKLANTNGNYNPKGNLGMALLAGGIIFFVMFSLLTLVLDFD
ncbi:MAG TPA: hypothetical protein VK978_02990 [Candidatus Saccharimonadales bacterium]|nr:hypothetical protein [Candidatus Saccharimonadales bacterium]